MAFHRRFRGLLHTGTVVHADITNPALQLDGVVAGDGSEALYKLSMLDLSLVWPPGRVTLPGLLPEVGYRLSLPAPNNRSDTRYGTPVAPPPPPRWSEEGVILSGRLLDTVGVQSPLLTVDELVIIHARATPMKDRP